MEFSYALFTKLYTSFEFLQDFSELLKFLGQLPVCTKLLLYRNLGKHHVRVHNRSQENFEPLHLLGRLPI